MPQLHRTVPVDAFMRNNALLHSAEVTLLQDQHNVNLHADGDGDEFLDDDAGDYEGLQVIDDAEFFDRYID